jgi:hypothetical protein
MKTLNYDEMEATNGGFPWASFAAGFLCVAGIATAEVGVGAVLAAAGCGSLLLSD